jgi:hypothetical protein
MKQHTPRNTPLPMRLERIMLKLCDGAVVNQKCKERIMLFLVFVEREFGIGTPKLKQIMRKIDKVQQR